MVSVGSKKNEIAARLVSAHVVSRLDYCNSILAGLPQTTLAPLQRVQNAAARLIKSLGPRDHITSTLRDLHWLPVEYRVQYKLCLMMHLVHIGRSPCYISELVTATTSLPSRGRLCSSAGNHYEIPKTRLKLGERSFSYAGPVAWNSLPEPITDITETDVFKKRLKTHLCALAYAD